MRVCACACLRSRWFEVPRRSSLRRTARVRMCEHSRARVQACKGARRCKAVPAWVPIRACPARQSVQALWHPDFLWRALPRCHHSPSAAERQRSGASRGLTRSGRAPACAARALGPDGPEGWRRCPSAYRPGDRARAKKLTVAAGGRTSDRAGRGAAAPVVASGRAPASNTSIILGPGPRVRARALRVLPLPEEARSISPPRPAGGRRWGSASAGCILQLRTGTSFIRAATYRGGWPFASHAARGWPVGKPAPGSAAASRHSPSQ